MSDQDGAGQESQGGGEAASPQATCCFPARLPTACYFFLLVCLMTKCLSKLPSSKDLGLSVSTLCHQGWVWGRVSLCPPGGIEPEDIHDNTGRDQVCLWGDPLPGCQEGLMQEETLDLGLEEKQAVTQQSQGQQV